DSMYFTKSDFDNLKFVRENKPKKRSKNDVRKPTKKQRKLDKYHNKSEQTPIIKMEKNMIENMNKISYMRSSSKTNDERVKREDLKIYGTIELKGMIGDNTYKTYVKRAKTFIRWCVKE